MRKLLVVGLIQTVFCLNVQAYVTPFIFNISEMTKKKLSLKTVRIRSKISTEDGSFKETAIIDTKRKIVYCRYANLQDQLLIDRYFKYDQKLNPLFELWFSPDLNRVLALMNTLHISTASTFLDRLFNQPIWVLGAKGGGSAMYMMKDEFYPLRIMSSNMGDISEIRFEDTKSQRGFEYPRKMFFLKRNKPVFQYETLDILTSHDSLPSQLESKDSSKPEGIREWIENVRSLSL